MTVQYRWAPSWRPQQHDVHRGGAQGKVGEGAAWARTAGLWRSSQSLTGISLSLPGPQDLKELEVENARLKKMYAEERLKAEILNEALTKKW